MSKRDQNSFDSKRDKAAEEYENILAPDDSWGSVYIAYKIGADWARHFIEAQRGLKNIFAEIDETKKDWADAEKRLHDKYASALVERDALKADLADKDLIIQAISKNNLDIEKDLENVIEKLQFYMTNCSCCSVEIATRTLSSLKSKLGRGEK